MKALIQRWFTRKARVPPVIRVLAASALAAFALLALSTPRPSTASGQATTTATAAQSGTSASIGGPPTSSPNAPAKSPEPAGAGNPTTRFPDTPQLQMEGLNLYQNGCSACHGPALEGEAGDGPSLVGVGPGPVDFYLSTGRMPLQNPHDEPMRGPPAFSRPEIDALIAYISQFGGPQAPSANPTAGNLAQGLAQFTEHCAGCHQIVGRGGLTLGAQVPNLQQSTAQQIAEAIRMGPYLMPHFGAQQIDQRQLNSIARYVLWTRHPDNAGGWGIGNIGPIPEGIVAWFMALAALVIVARLIGERTT